MKFNYQLYYKYMPTKSNFMDDELTQEEVERNKVLLIDDLKTHFSDLDNAVDVSSDGIISITTHLTQTECDKVLAGYLSSLHLLAYKVQCDR